MPKTDGEKVNWVGHSYSDFCEKIIPLFGYSVVKTRADGKDSICDSSSGKSPLLQPLFAPPPGRVIFDFTSSGAIEEKISKLEEHLAKDSKLSGAFIFTNYKLNEKQVKDALDKKVYCWDDRTLSFYLARHALQKFWSKTGTVVEQKLDSDASFVRAIGKVKSTFQINSAILFHSPLGEIGAQDLKDATDKLAQNIIENGLYPGQVNLTVITRSYFRKDLLDRFGAILDELGGLKPDQLVFVAPKDPLVDFYSSATAFSAALARDIYI